MSDNSFSEILASIAARAASILSDLDSRVGSFSAADWDHMFEAWGAALFIDPAREELGAKIEIRRTEEGLFFDISKDEQDSEVFVTFRTSKEVCAWYVGCKFARGESAE